MRSQSALRETCASPAFFIRLLGYITGARTEANSNEQGVSSMAYRSLVAAVEGVQFPIEKRAFMRKYGEREVEVLEGKVIALRELLRSCEKDSFESVDVVGCKGVMQHIAKAA